VQLFSNYSFCRKNIGAKAVRKVLMKLTTGIVAKLDRMIKIELRPFLLFVLMLKII